MFCFLGNIEIHTSFYYYVNKVIPRRVKTFTTNILQIYNGRVANIVPFGCFVQIEGVRKRWEGLVHISQLRAEGRVTNVSDVVNRGDKVKVSLHYHSS